MSARADRWLVVAFGLSGTAALGYELLWTQLLSIALGHETLGVLGVLAGFFGGMAVGAAVLHPRVKKATNPARLFAKLEWIAAGYAFVSPWLLHALARRVPAMLGDLAGDNDTALALGVTIVISALALLPATFCMGATLPALVEARRRTTNDEPDGRGVGRLYAANTLGAVAGVVLTTYALLPSLGLAGASAVLASLGLGSGFVALRWGRNLPGPVDDEATAINIDASRDPDPEIAREPWLLLVVLGATGFLGVALEVVGVQVLSQTLENTIYTFAHTLAVYLLGTSAGAMAYARWVKPAVSGRPAWVLAGLLVAQAASVVLTAAALSSAPDLLASWAPEGSEQAAHLRAEWIIALAVFAVPTLIMGATFSHVVGLLAARGVGRAYAINTLGGAIAPLVFAMFVVPEYGYRDALFACAYGYLLTFGVFTWYRRFTAKVQLAAIFTVIALTFTAPADLVLTAPDQNWKVLEQRETMMGLVIVSEQAPAPDAQPGATPLRKLQVGQHFRMGGVMAFGERRMGHLPLLLHDNPTRALFLGVGTGATLGAVTHYKSLHTIDAVELVPAVVDQLHYFADINGDVANAEHVNFHRADARRFVAATSQQYDVIVADLFHPGRNGAGGLYSKEHFEAIRERLADGGLFAQWVPLYQVDLPTLKLIVRTFVDVFDPAQAWLGVYNVQTPAIALIGAKDPGALELDVSRIAATVAAPVYATVLMQEPRDLLGAHLMGRDGLVALGGEGPLNTDMYPRVMLNAPQVAYEGDRGRGWTNLSSMLNGRTTLTLSGEDGGRWSADASRFSTALDGYLRAEAIRANHAATDLKHLPESAVVHYLEAYDAAPDFAPARGMLYLAMSQGSAHVEMIFERMQGRTPDEPRVYQAYLGYLKSIGDAERFAQIRNQAVGRFATPQDEAPAPDSPTAPDAP